MYDEVTTATTQARTLMQGSGEATFVPITTLSWFRMMQDIENAAISH